jgi:hypothetical protein
MPPKKQEKQGGGKKPSATKMVEDRTFGMKNKKGAQTQRQIAQMTQSAKAGGTPEEKKKAAEKAQAERDKAASLAAQKETMELFKPVQVQKVAFGVDPKTVLCQFYKKGHCEKGKKCKFSHDLAVERKTEIYTKIRERRKRRQRRRRLRQIGTRRSCNPSFYRRRATRRLRLIRSASSLSRLSRKANTVGSGIARTEISACTNTSCHLGMHTHKLIHTMSTS